MAHSVSRLLEGLPVHFVYKLLNINNEVLYVGKTTSVQHRLQRHMKSTYGPMIVKVEVVAGLTRLEAQNLEREMIFEELPPFNLYGKRPLIS